MWGDSHGHNHHKTTTVEVMHCHQIEYVLSIALSAYLPQLQLPVMRGGVL